ncbi:tetratricopeptide repeat protein [Tuwongella immobilis]|nr:tetratricopeptide repeat protein [Tuwongella immobilis]
MNRGRWRVCRTLAIMMGITLSSVGCFKQTSMSLRMDTTSMNTAVASSASEPTLDARDSASLSLAMAESLEREGKELEAAAYYEQARTQSPDYADRASRRLAVLYDQLDEQAKAMGEYQALLQKYPKDSALLNDLGYSYYNRGQWSEAESYLRRAVQADPKNKRAALNLGLTMAQQGQVEEALHWFTQSVTPAEAQANLGFVLAAQGKRDEAIAAYRQALQLEPALTLARQALDRLAGKVPAPLPAALEEQTPGS